LAVLDAGRSAANLAKRQAVVRGYLLVQMALARDFLWALIGLGLPTAPARQDAREQPLDA